MQDEEAIEASREAVRGAGWGALKWGAACGVLGGVGYAASPIYRGLTIQFKVYLQMSGTFIGAAIEADHRMRQYEARMRVERRVARDRAMWAAFEEKYGKDDDE